MILVIVVMKVVRSLFYAFQIRVCQSPIFSFAELTKFDRRSRPGQGNIRDRARNRAMKVDMVPMRPQTIGSNHAPRPGDQDATLGQRRMSQSANTAGKSSFRTPEHDDVMAISWVPSSYAGGEKSDRQSKSRNGKDRHRKGVETFAAGLERGVEERMEISNDSERQGRSHRRKGVRSGSKNAFRRR